MSLKIFNTAMEMLNETVSDFQEDHKTSRSITRFEQNVQRLSEMAVGAAKDMQKDTFIEDSSIEPEVFSDSEYDRDVLKNLKRKRPVSAVQYLSDVDDDDDVIDLEAEACSADASDCDTFLTNLRDNRPLKAAVKASFWFQRRYHNIISTIRDNLGRQSKNGQALENWDIMITDTFNWSEEYFPEVEHKDRSKSYHSKCALCAETRKCAHTIWLRGHGYPIGIKCSALAEAVITFYTKLYECVHEDTLGVDAIRYLDEAMASIQEAHAGKTSF